MHFHSYSLQLVEYYRVSIQRSFSLLRSHEHSLHLFCICMRLQVEALLTEGLFYKININPIQVLPYAYTLGLTLLIDPW